MTPIHTADSYPTMKPIHLYWRDGLEAAKWIFANPVFANHMQYDPVKVFTNEFSEEREFSEYFTANYAWDIQVTVLPLPHTTPQTDVLIFRTSCLPEQLSSGLSVDQIRPL